MHKSYGGQALIEGVMMRGKHHQAMAVRLDDGRIESLVTPFTPWGEAHPILRLPFIRGSVNMVESLVVGMKALSWSTNVNLSGGMDAEEEAVKPWQMALTVLMSLLLSIGIFFLLPVLLAHAAGPWISGVLAQNLLEGVLRVGIFLLYICLIAQMPDIHRVFQYHGAEHKSIHCYEKGAPLAPASARRFSRLHPRCGTSFLFIVMVVSIFVFSFTGVDNILLRLFSRVLLLPVIAGVSYEILKWTGRHMDRPIVRLIAWPGMQIQRMTTAEPDEDMLEVALVALEKVRLAEKDQEPVPFTQMTYLAAQH
ncbi:DUF1385 domain-containing protein [Peptococcus simiae]|uniref:DUF1385 domain-containing protein n=1 Tax=Peptococcus simiae TaxID=1643805 RepID=A0ABW9H116_9FIRM